VINQTVSPKVSESNLSPEKPNEMAAVAEQEVLVKNNTEETNTNIEATNSITNPPPPAPPGEADEVQPEKKSKDSVVKKETIIVPSTEDDEIKATISREDELRKIYFSY
jgi:hypothetical protein